MDSFSPTKDRISRETDRKALSFCLFWVSIPVVMRQNEGAKLAEESQNQTEVISQKRGVPVYRTNPSIIAKDEISRHKRTRIGNEQRGLVIDGGTGEIFGRGGAYAYEFEEVDKERFVKLFLGGLKQASGLSKAGLAVFEVVYHQIREKPNSDEVQLSFYRASQYLRDIGAKTYQRGLRELLEREFLFRSPEDGTFFINIRYMFNGDRLAFVKAYQLKDTQPSLPFADE
jgi:hypothetical protein